ncbi:hypothetical protein [Streptosporangium minutum]|uniref:hypothetical protein n=1 Tax=Streptosporangium minutum TaxID=569862 RepID=UPI003BF95B0E
MIDEQGHRDVAAMRLGGGAEMEPAQLRRLGLLLEAAMRLGSGAEMKLASEVYGKSWW